MLIEPNWGIFQAKFNGREQNAFEWLCSLLFNREHNLPTGTTRYFNQAGIEAEPANIETEVIGWQAKFIETSISSYKAKLKESIDTAKSQHPTLTKIYFYINMDFGRARNSAEKDPKYKIEIENHAKAKGISIEWKTKVFFETPFVCNANADISRHFFTLEKSVIDFLEEVDRHTKAVLEPIHSEIVTNNGSIKIDRQPELNRLKGTLLHSPLVIISGEAGVGKTAIIKDFYNEKKDKFPFYVFKSTEFNVSNINQLFKEYGNYVFSDFIREHDEYLEKYIVIDSAEKLADSEYPEVFQEFLSSLRNAGWMILFTTRLSYLDDLKYAFIEIFNVPFEPINISGLAPEKLEELSQTHKFPIPDNERLRSVLQNPFYLNEYLRLPQQNKATSDTEFRDSIWRSKIASSAHQKNNNHRKREDCFIEVARLRANTGQFFVCVEGYEKELRQLESEEIIKFDDNARGYFITHDIYEELALERIIEQAFVLKSTYFQFYEQIGNALAIRRAYRDWLSEKLVNASEDASRLIETTVSDQTIPQHWKDEAIIATLLSNYSGTFIEYFEKKLLEYPPQHTEQDTFSTNFNKTSGRYIYEQSLLYRIIFLLRIACKEADQRFLSFLGKPQGDQLTLSSFVTQPKGSGWESVIAFLFRNKETIGLRYMYVVLPLLDDWTQHNKQGETTRKAGQIALFYFHKLTEEDNLRYSKRDETSEKLIRIILNSSRETKEELSIIFRGIIERKEISNTSPYRGLVATALSSFDKSANIAANLPNEVISLANIVWPDTPPERDGWSSYRSDMEQHFNLARSDHDYYPASAFQTPILQLLHVAPRETVDFILAFVNRSIAYFVKTRFANEIEEIDVYMTSDEKPSKQYISKRLWLMYRGGVPAPTLLESIHMALEKWLLDLAKQASSELIESWCLYLVKNTCSASITAVVASIVLAEPTKLFKVAQVLFRTKSFFFFDLQRILFDRTAKSLYAINSPGFFRDERLQTTNDKHRNQSLEHLVLGYQLFHNKSESEELAKERQEIIWKILDEHYAQLPKDENESEDIKTWRLFLARMDRRKMAISSEVKDDQMLLTFNPEIALSLREYSEQSQEKTTNFLRYTSLTMWAQYRWEKNYSEYSKYPQYDNDPKYVIEDIRAVCDSLKTKEGDDEVFRIMNRAIPPHACAVLVRDFANALNQEDKEFCRDTLLEFASQPLCYNYNYQAGDGLDAAIGALPLLMNIFPECSAEAKLILLFSLFDLHPVGANKRFSDYAIQAIADTLWKISPEDVNSLFLGYLSLRPKFESLCQLLLAEMRAKEVYQYSHADAIQHFLKEYESELFEVMENEIKYDPFPLMDQIAIDTLVTAFLLLPLNTVNQQHKTFATEVASVISTKSYRRNRHNDDETLDYDVLQRFLKKFAYFVLSSDKSDISAYIQPFIDQFMEIDFAEKMLQDFISAEDELNCYDNFWIVWELFYPCIVEYCKKNRHSSSVIYNYLLAWPYWRKDTKEWHSLKEREKGFFARVALEIGYHPTVLYSLAKLLNDIGSGFATDGILWIGGILERHPNLFDEKLETNTVYYLENLIRRYVLHHRQKVRTTAEIKQAILTILNFLLEKGSVTAYLTRENIL